ncbi:MAG: hypothetical protein H5U02_00100 [Clostridia bacterium]|nr:hypothetical protein [Clostridia bacterium]
MNSLTEVPIPAWLQAQLEPGARAFRLGGCTVIVGRSDAGWHLSISHPDRYPTWDEIKEARYLLVPDNVTMAMLLPPKTEYVNVHKNCFHLWQIKEPHSSLVIAR